MDPNIFDRRDPVEKFLDRTAANRIKTGDSSFNSNFDEKESGKVDVRKMGLGEYLRRYTSEDSN